MATSDKLQLLMNTKNNLKNVLNSHQEGSITDETPFSEYPDVAEELLSNITPAPAEDDEWQPEPDWWDIETILEEDEEDYEYKAIFLLTNEYDYNTLLNNSILGFKKYKLSDGQTINTTSRVYTDERVFDTTQDKLCSKGYKTRYIIAYTNTKIINYSVPNNSIYTIFDGVERNDATSSFSNCYFLQAIKFKNGATLTGNNLLSCFQNDYNLRKIEGLDFSSFNVLNNTFVNCFYLDINKFNIDILISSGSSLFTNCINTLDFSNIDISNLDNLYPVSGCNNMKKFFTFDKEKIYNVASSGVINSCNLLESLDIKLKLIYSGYFSFISNAYNLKNVKYLDLSELSYNSGISLFFNCPIIMNIEEIVGPINVKLHFQNNLLLNHDTLMRIINAYADRTGMDALILQLGTTNLAKLTDEEKAVATNKNIILQ